MKIALDAMGGDLAPKAVIEGAVLAARELRVEVVLVGRREVIAKELAEHEATGLAIEVEHAAEMVAMDDAPLESVLDKPESSIHVGLELVKQGRADGFVSAGNSGAMMAAAMAILGTLPGVDRPAIASLVPTTAGFALLIDAGANVEVKPLHLMQFGVMGSVYWHRVFGVERPRVGLLSNGEEPSKGTDLTRAAADALAQMAPDVNYIGYVEGRDINRAKADVVVTDGFTGNVALKTMEGFAAFMLGNLREVFSTGLLRRLAYLLIRRKLSAIRERLDPSEYGGAPLLGVNGIAIIAHGSSNARAIRNAVRAAANEALVRQVNSDIVEILAHSPAAMAGKPSSKGFRALLGKMRERLHLHREPDRKPDRPAKPEARPERISTGDRSERPEKIDKTEILGRTWAAEADAHPGSPADDIPAAVSPDSQGEAAARKPAQATPAVPSSNGTARSHRRGEPNQADPDGAEDRAETAKSGNAKPTKGEPS